MNEALNTEDLSLIARLRSGGTPATSSFFDQHRAELKRMASYRMDPRLDRRIDASDVVQEASINYAAQVERYLDDPQISPVAWLRRLLRHVLCRINRHHMEAQCRDIRREDGIYLHSMVNIDQLAESLSSVGSKIARLEQRERIYEIINEMSPIDREILMLVHVEDRKVRQAAMELDIQLDAAKKRYRRALKRLRIAYRKDQVET